MSDANVACSAGLTTEQALVRLRTDGPNALAPPRRRPGFLRLADQMVGFFALMLWVAGALAVAAGLPQLGAAIVGVIAVNGLSAFAQENRADHVTDRLRSLLPRQVTVRQDFGPWGFSGDARKLKSSMTTGGAMSQLTAHDAVFGALHQVAREVDPGAVPPGADLHEELSRDSLDRLNIVVGIAETTGVEMPTADYPQPQTLEACVRYVSARMDRT